MYEIELKAHVQDCNAVRKRLAQFAQYVERIHKDDHYYRKIATDGMKLPSIRIRTERATCADGTESTRHLLTYKRKEQRNGTEVNEELESLLENPAVLHAFLQDSGHTMYLHKQKESEFYTVHTDSGTAHLELCTVPPLGWFIEIEIICADNAATTVARAQAELHVLLAQCGIAESAVEPRYYSELLQGT